MMKLPRSGSYTYEQYESMRKDTDQILEYIDGVIYMSPSPSTIHQRISMRLSAQLFTLLDGKGCEVFAAPYDIMLTDENADNKKTVIPDLSVICDKKGFTDKRYNGVPELIIEIVSPSNQSHDLIFKTNLYQQYKVKEYWIINPILKVVMVYALGEDDTYRLIANEKQGTIASGVIEGFILDVDTLF